MLSVGELQYIKGSLCRWDAGDIIIYCQKLLSLHTTSEISVKRVILVRSCHNKSNVEVQNHLFHHHSSS